MSGEESRRLVHELRARSDAVAVGMGTFRADTAPAVRGVEPMRQPRVWCSGAGRCPRVAARAREEPPAEALARLAAEGVQSLLLEGGPTLAAAFLAGGLVDKLSSSSRPSCRAQGLSRVPGRPRTGHVHGLEAERVGEDVLLTGYSREP